MVIASLDCKKVYCTNFNKNNNSREVCGKKNLKSQPSHSTWIEDRKKGNNMNSKGESGLEVLICLLKPKWERVLSEKRCR